MISVLFSLFLSLCYLAFWKSLLQLLFGRVESSVMDACITYLRISVFSYPALAVYNAGLPCIEALEKQRQRCIFLFYPISLM